MCRASCMWEFRWESLRLSVCVPYPFPNIHKRFSIPLNSIRLSARNRLCASANSQLIFVNSHTFIDPNYEFLFDFAERLQRGAPLFPRLENTCFNFHSLIYFSFTALAIEITNEKMFFIKDLARTALSNKQQCTANANQEKQCKSTFLDSFTFGPD